jgi:proteasome lid subunit RPN8/RPN11
MTNRVDLPAVLAGAVRAQALAAAPRECCGLIEGVRDDDLWRVIALHPVRNLSTDADRFEMDPQDQFAAQKAARANGRTIIGCYHSHPGGRAQPSDADRMGAGEENFLWLIAGADGLNAFVYLRGKFTGADWVTSSA